MLENFERIEIGYRADGLIINRVTVVGTDGSRIDLPTSHVASEAKANHYQKWTFSVFGHHVRHVEGEPA